MDNIKIKEGQTYQHVVSGQTLEVLNVSILTIIVGRKGISYRGNLIVQNKVSKQTGIITAEDFHKAIEEGLLTLKQA